MSGITSNRRTVPVPCTEKRKGVCTRDVWNVNMSVCDACFSAIYAVQGPILIGPDRARQQLQR